jgi:hypothetical protein
MPTQFAATPLRLTPGKAVNTVLFLTNLGTAIGRVFSSRCPFFARLFSTVTNHGTAAFCLQIVKPSERWKDLITFNRLKVQK